MSRHNPEISGGQAGEQAASIARIEISRKLKSIAVPALALAGLFSTIAWVQPKLLSLRALAALATDATPLLMLVMGSAVVILLGGIDLSVATMASFAAVTFVILNPALGDLAFVAVVVVAGTIGALQGYVHHRAQIPSFVVSFGSLGMLYGVTHFISNATAAPLSQPSAIISFFGGRTAGLPNGMIVVLVSAAILGALFRFTRLGREIFAVGASERAALLSGVKTVRVKVSAFAISAICASVAGLLLLGQTGYSSPAMANNYLLPAVVGVVVGGTAISGGIGGIGCALIGGLIAGLVRIGTVIVGLNPAYQNIVFGVVIVIAVAITIDREKIGIVK
ncbi:ABC transporter permease [Mesorhizobium sp. M3A.F.Ca.ET.201.01.1.1]|uniref:ABC transporter permease n=1 Tax=Mesorhizobium sp. M3A.F.Ca.ET.201.01.1.1 TaxID=2563946 RepID=UPI001093BF48|nr:ABC transporter permease [Mesorhizobium sp. M3A.F.Ca.ET.201.01.1.1]TGS71688.1 ABC transporter permease [Mesorhizobium sp. M3A.F.Ca.ET.201.01.1.1]